MKPHDVGRGYGRYVSLEPFLSFFCLAIFAEASYSYADYGFEYSDEDVQEEDVDIENQYYNSKGEHKTLP